MKLMGFLIRGGIFKKYSFVTLSLFSVYMFVLGLWNPEQAVVHEYYGQPEDARQQLAVLEPFNNNDDSWKGYFKRTIQSLASQARQGKSDPSNSSSPNSSFIKDNVKENWNFTGPYYPHPQDFVINPKNVCNFRRVFLLNVIHSRSTHFQRRNIIRTTWGEKSMSDKIDVLTIFFTGLTNDRNTDAKLRAENDKYHDVVQGNYVDSYKNLTYKAISILRWVNSFCTNAEYILKTDDDVFVNTFDIIRLIRRQRLREPDHSKIMCRMGTGIVHRELTSKWYMSQEEYPYKRYPPFCKGAAFIMPGSVIPRLHKATLTTKFFWIDDVYSTGMLAYVANVSHVNLVNKFIYFSNDPRKDLLFGEGATTHVDGGYTAEIAKEHWKEILEIEQNALR